ncbi:uncharacterized protein FIBRA_07603 [Fibroporia radiculosa]|uniref:Distal membrane-arm assembly complex protein 1-like domain-containing protein n=1 Tax=Fibroporia radiculosa TaxID=599839 RepID=J4I0Z9_9APHY|nr:uncharacterized protein FIBRA_07603 [Fibroporia radiculosa]CCM05387.1 predicted protein [Fibroporia radiculosa]
MSVLESQPTPSQASGQSQPRQPQDCLACRVIGTAALGGVGIYALNQSRAHQPGSVVGKRIVAGLGVCFLVASALRWSK